MTNGISDYEESGDSVSLVQMGTNPFTIVGVIDSAYESNGKSTPGVKITLKEPLEYKGTEYSKVHTTRVAIVSKLRSVNDKGEQMNQKLLDALASGTEITVKCEQIIPEDKKKKPYWVLVDG